MQYIQIHGRQCRNDSYFPSGPLSIWEGEATSLHPSHPVLTHLVQWAAVSTQQGWINAPPQKWPWGMEEVKGSEVCRDACHGCLPAVLLKPP